MREKLIEDTATKAATRAGWTSYKWSSPNNTGVLDRLYFKKGYTFAIEYKKPGKRASPKQRHEAEKLTKAGIACRCYWSVPKATAFIGLMTRIAEKQNRILYESLVKHNMETFEP